MKVVTAFYAHKARIEQAELDAGAALLQELLVPKLEAKFGEPIKLRVVFGRDDFSSYFHGDWNSWAEGVATRRNATTGKLLYDLFICPDRRVGRATASLLIRALQTQRSVFVLNAEAQRITRVHLIACLDDTDWASGYHLIIRPEEEDTNVPARDG